MDLVKAFLIGGSIIAGAKAISLRIDPIYAPLLAAFPSSFLTAVFLKNDNVRKKYYYGNLIADSVLAFSILFIFLSIRYFPDINIDYFSIAGYFIWITISFILITIQIHYRKK